MIDAGHSTRVLDDFSTGYLVNVPPEADLVEGDIADEAVVRKAVEDVEIVFHHAAHRAVLQSVERPLATDLANTHGTLTVLKAAVDAGVRRVVYASSSSVYGGAAQLPTPETAATVPRSPYAVTKLAAEHYCRVFAELYGLETVALRYFNVYGPQQRPDSAYAAVVPLFMKALARDEPITVHGDGMQTRDFTYISDVLAANAAAALAPAERCVGKAYNIAGGRAHSLMDLLGVLGSIFGKVPRAVHTDQRPGDIRHSLADIGAARRELMFEPRIGIEDGLRQTMRWFMAQGRFDRH